jgi:hypothetical protein
LADPTGGKRTWWIGLAIAAVLIVFAYGFAATEVNLDQIRSEPRRVGLVRILRSLARPELIEYDRQNTITDSPVLIPCQEGAASRSQHRRLRLFGQPIGKALFRPGVGRRIAPGRRSVRR